MLRTIGRISLLNACSFHSSPCLNAKLGRAMKKVLGYTSKKKRIYSESGILPSAEMFSKGSQEGRYSSNARRASVLNKLFMKYITDLLATGEYSSEFLNHAIEISRVQISPDYNGLNVFWVAKGTQNDEVVEKVLKKNSGFLRHELSTLRVMGVVPTIYFVKDKQYSRIMEVESRLSKADFGEDFVPTQIATRLKTQLELFTPLPSSVKEKIQELDGETSRNEADEDLIPCMPQDVLGLNRLEILNRIQKSMRKSEAAHRLTNSDLGLMQTVNENPIEFANNKERRIAFKEFLAKRELLKSRARKMEQKYFPDIEYMREEFEECHANYFNNLEFYEDRHEEDSDDIK